MLNLANLLYNQAQADLQLEFLESIPPFTVEALSEISQCLTADFVCEIELYTILKLHPFEYVDLHLYIIEYFFGAWYFSVEVNKNNRMKGLIFFLKVKLLLSLRRRWQLQTNYLNISLKKGFLL